MNKEEEESILESFPAGDDHKRLRINVGRLYDQKYSILLSKLYKKVDVQEDDGKDDPVDEAGYLGEFYREKQKGLIPITEEEFV